jgi:hypothetical protein
MNQYQDAAQRVHQYLLAHLERTGALLGPDPGVRVNYRIGRFVKGYLPSLPWHDDLYYLQGQGYWVLGNWLLADRTGKPSYHDFAVRASAHMLSRQRPDGAWDYPNPEWHGRVANAEGTWGAMGLVMSYRKTGQRRFLDGALRWHGYMIEHIGFQREGDRLAVNYFGHRDGARVPNNSAFVLPFLADLADVTGDQGYLEPCKGMLAFLGAAQTEAGEFPYEVHGITSGGDRPHYQCYQYNAFQCVDLIRYWELTGDETALKLARGVIGFLRSGQAADGHAPYMCGDTHRAVTYHSAVLGAAFVKATQTGMGDYRAEGQRAFSYVLNQQRGDGSFPHSRGDYRVLGDRRNYPRYLAMIMVHLMLAAAAPEFTKRRSTEADVKAGRNGKPAASVPAKPDAVEDDRGAVR